MAIFEFQAVDPTGKAIKGTISGADLKVAEDTLRQRGLTQFTISPVFNPGDPLAQDPPTQADTPPTVKVTQPGFFESFFTQVPLTQIQMLFTRMASVIGAGINPAQGMDSLARQTSNAKLAQSVREMGLAASSGQPMSSVMVQYPAIYTPMMVSIMVASERGGMVESGLRDLAAYVQEEIEVRTMIRRETLMPKLTLIMSIVIVLGANLIIRIFAPGSPFGLWSPLTEPKTWLFLGPVLVVMFLVVRAKRSSPGVKYAWDAVVFRIPVLGPLVYDYAISRFARTFGALYRGGVSMAEGVELAAHSTGNAFISSHILTAVERLRQGEPLTQTLAQTGMMNPVMLDMLATGERTGDVDQMMQRAAQFHFDEATMRARVLGKVLGIVVLIMVAIYVAIVVLNFYTGYVTTILGIAD